MLTKALLFISWIGIFAGAQAQGEPTVQRYFPKLEGYRFVMQEEISQLEVGSCIGPFSAAILQEALWRSYSNWFVTRPDGREFRLEVYDLRDPSGAFQLLSLWPHIRGEEEWNQLELPAGNYYLPDQGLFWCGNFLFRVTPVKGAHLSREAFGETVTSFSNKLALENLLPVTVTHLPREDLTPGSVQFYLGASSLALNERFPAPLLKDIGLEDQIEIAYGRYEPEGTALFLIGYPTPSLADEYFVNLQKSLQNFFSAEGVYMKRAGVVIAVFVGSEPSAQRVLGKVKYTPTIKWLYQKEPERYSDEVFTFFGLLTKTILGTGVFILLIVGAGCVTGLVRYEILRRFPGLGKRKETVQLELDRMR